MFHSYYQSVVHHFPTLTGHLFPCIHPHPPPTSQQSIRGQRRHLHRHGPPSRDPLQPQRRMLRRHERQRLPRVAPAQRLGGQGHLRTGPGCTFLQRRLPHRRERHRQTAGGMPVLQRCVHNCSICRPLLLSCLNDSYTH